MPNSFLERRTPKLKLVQAKEILSGNINFQKPKCIDSRNNLFKNGINPVFELLEEI